MASAKNLAQEVFKELSKKKNIDKAYNTFTKELIGLVHSQPLTT